VEKPEAKRIIQHKASTTRRRNKKKKEKEKNTVKPEEKRNGRHTKTVKEKGGCFAKKRGINWKEEEMVSEHLKCKID